MDRREFGTVVASAAVLPMASTRTDASREKDAETIEAAMAYLGDATMYQDYCVRRSFEVREAERQEIRRVRRELKRMLDDIRTNQD